MRAPSPAKKVKGQLTIGRVHSGTKIFIYIEVIDKASGCMLTQIYVDPGEFSKAVTGLSMQLCEVEFYADCPAGKTREIKHELVKVPPKFNLKSEHERKEAAKKLLKPFEKGGWVGSASDLDNHYNFVSDVGGYKVHFIRFV